MLDKKYGGVWGSITAHCGTALVGAFLGDFKFCRQEQEGEDTHIANERDSRLRVCEDVGMRTVEWVGRCGIYTCCRDMKMHENLAPCALPPWHGIRHIPRSRPTESEVLNASRNAIGPIKWYLEVFQTCIIGHVK